MVRRWILIDKMKNVSSAQDGIYLNTLNMWFNKEFVILLSCVFLNMKIRNLI